MRVRVRVFPCARDKGEFFITATYALEAISDRLSRVCPSSKSTR